MTESMRELYQEVILDHGRRPRNFFACPSANCIKEGFNPLCGDKLTVYLNLQDAKIQAASFDGCGCAISIASASLMTEVIKDKNLCEINELFDLFHDIVTLGKLNEKNTASDIEKLGKLMVLAGVSQYPARVKCATLAWHTLMAAISNKLQPVSTE